MYKIFFNLKSFDICSLNATEKYLLTVFSFFKCNSIEYQTAPKKCKKITVLRSPHIDKKSREQFQLITYKKKIVISTPNKNIVLILSELLKNIQINGVEMELIVEFSTY